MSVPPIARQGKDAAAQLLAERLRTVPDFPQPGVQFADLTPALAHGPTFAALVAWQAELEPAIDVVVGIEARGFLLGPAVAGRLGVGFVGLRKPGKLPAVAAREEYQLEYGHAQLELPLGVLQHGDRVLVVDDVLATGGTAAAALRLVRAVGADPVAFAAPLELTALDGRAPLAGEAVHTLLLH